MIALGAPLLTTVDAAAGPFAKRTSLKAVIFEDVKPLYQKSGDTYEGFGVDMLNLIKDQAGRRTLKFIPTTSAEDGMNAKHPAKPTLLAVWPLTGVGPKK